MKLFIVVLLALLVLFIALALYIRLAPSNVERWHIDPSSAGDPRPGGVLRVVKGDLLQFHAIVGQAERVKVLAGSVDEGRITYVSRSKMMGFPDYITVQHHDDELTILSRLRFGKSDLGVNAARLEGWLKRL